MVASARLKLRRILGVQTALDVRMLTHLYGVRVRIRFGQKKKTLHMMNVSHAATTRGGASLEKVVKKKNALR